MVGAGRFELTTSCTRNKRATRLRYAPTHEAGENALVLRDCNCFFRHGTACDPSGCPGRLEIETARDAVDVQHFTREIEAGTDSAFHRFKIHFVQSNSTARD